MLGTLLQWKVVDLMGVAGATIGVIIANAIFLSSFIAKYVPVVDRYRALCQELRGGKPSDERQDLLREEIRCHQDRIGRLRRGHTLLCISLFCFLFAVAGASLGVIFPTVIFIKVLCAVTLFLGLGLMGGATMLALRENLASRREVESELADLVDAL